MPAYTAWVLVFLVVPITALWAVFHRRLTPYVRLCFVGALLGTPIAGIWDHIGYTHHIWYFPTGSILGPTFWDLPLEEWGFLFLMNILLTSITILLATRKSP